MDALILKVIGSRSYLELNTNEVIELEKYYNMIDLRVECHFNGIWYKTRKRIKLKCIPCNMTVDELIVKIKNHYCGLFDRHSRNEWDILTVDGISLFSVNLTITVGELSNNGQLIVRIVKTYSHVEDKSDTAILYEGRIDMPWLTRDVLNSCSIVVLVETGPLEGCVTGLDKENTNVHHLLGTAVDKYPRCLWHPKI